MKKIGVIKLSAFGDFMLAMGHFKAIREHHKDDHITLITTKPFKEMAEKSGYFDAVILDTRPKFSKLKDILALRRLLRREGFDRIYDLQINGRTALYYRLLWSIPGVFKGQVPEWAGTARFCDFYTPDERKKNIHAYERGNKVLAAAGIENNDLPDLSWMQGDISGLGLSKKVALLVPGCAPSRPLKKWSAENYAGLARYFHSMGIQPVLLGGPAEAVIGEKMKETVPEVVNAIGQTSFYDLAELGRHALFAVGNDTGPTHVLALSGCPTLTLFSSDSEPLKSRPIGAHATHLRRESLDDLSLDEVVDMINLKLLNKDAV